MLEIGINISSMGPFNDKVQEIYDRLPRLNLSLEESSPDFL